MADEPDAPVAGPPGVGPAPLDRAVGGPGRPGPFDVLGLPTGGGEPMNVRRRADRPGYSLIEMVLGDGGMTIIIVLCGVLLHTLLRLDRGGRESLNDTATIARLARSSARTSGRRPSPGQRGPGLWTSPGPTALQSPTGPRGAVSAARSGTGRHSGAARLTPRPGSAR